MLPAVLRSSFSRLIDAAKGLPLWTKWVLTLLFFGLLTLWIALDWHAGGPLTPEVSAEDEVNRAAEEIIVKDQAPHTASLGAGISAARALEHAIAADVQRRVAHVELPGPLQSIHCTPSGASQAGRRPYRCSVHVAGRPYTFVGVVDERSHALTWCKQDLPPTSESPMFTEVSTRCLR
jgi:hypothetical protein